MGMFWGGASVSKIREQAEQCCCGCCLFSEGSGTGAKVSFSGAIVFLCAWEQFDLNG
jgi:hypothetical protein